MTFILFVRLPQGFSISKAWARVEDNGITYCTLYNLIEGETFDTVLNVVMQYCFSFSSPSEHLLNLFCAFAGSGLVEAAGYKQYTNEWICLDYSTANCTIY